MNNSQIKEADAVSLAQALIRRPSVTPRDEGALDVLQSVLEKLGFVCHRLPFEEEGTAPVDNLYARLGTGAPHFCYAGHTDVVPVGDEAAWSSAPFEAAIRDGQLFGRGAADMKGSIAAFVNATANFLAASPQPNGSISLLITGDEEGAAINGTRKMLMWLKEKGEVIDHCLVGEPTNKMALGDMIKIGRRGSISAHIKAFGTQGHVAYPHLADNPLPRLIALLNRFAQAELDKGTDHFQPSNLEIVTVDVGNTVSNLIPAEAYGRFNIRFNNTHTTDSLKNWIEGEVSRFQSEMGGQYETWFTGNGEAFLTEPGEFTSLIVDAAKDETGLTPELSTSGGTSDARFIKDYAPVVEFGLVGQTMHKVDENVSVSDIETLTRIFTRVLNSYFSAFGR